MPMKVWREVVRIQRNFLWGVKWRWRLLSEEGEFWKNVLLSKYGEGVCGNANLDNMAVGHMCSTWRKDLCKLDKDVRWFSQVVAKKVGSGNSVDRWVWKPNEEEGFSVRSMYVLLDLLLVPRALVTPLEAFPFRTIWKCAVPSKVSAVAWQLFWIGFQLEIYNLCHRGIICIVEASCAMCGREVESSRHLFMHCDFAAQIWYAICGLRVVVILPPDVMTMYGTLVGSGRNKKIKNGFSVVWLAFVWVIWRCWNDKIFNNVAGVVEDAVDMIQRISWHWFVSITAKGPCLLYEWIWNPGECMFR
ncbi:hypothetical protein TSUD_286560 [Trifolium subterraneum]|uniref:Reverse transcriptase zinc-binding domain-containing protein n=1 Tax=Trifolium subterraneum TaxID=3900 RepID=A0A2Z6NJ26_TRISU|nr:hypothetical protein TSUD_286560 [Trifolium subterraneum]